jgi:serine protease inhibitor
MPLVAAPTVDFGFRLLERLETGAAISPVSIHTALATVREGASGRARAALDEVLGEQPPAPLEVGDPAIDLALAQAVWVDRGYRLATQFASRAAELGVDCRTLDFGDPRAPTEVNAWAAEKTRGMIREVVESFDPDEQFALANAAYFEGAWTLPFDPQATEPRPFTRPDGARGDVPTMLARGDYEFGEDDHLQAIRLPYGNDLELGFVAVIARDGLEPPRLDAAGWSALRTAMSSRAGTVALPRIHIQSSLQLGDALTALGLGPAFEPGADFDGLFEGPGEKALSRVLHHTRVDVDEEGTRAAAVTVVVAAAVSAPMNVPPPFELRLDRPFLWAIEHRPTGTLLFLGIATDPTEESS